MSELPFRTLAARTVLENPWFKIERHELERTGDGHRFTYNYLSANPSVMVVGVTREGLIPIVRQYRYPTRRFSYELPGGGSGGLPPEEAARKELEEETGFRAANTEKIGEFVTYSGLSDEICSVVLATRLEPGEQRLEPTEHIRVLEVGYARLEEMIAAGEFCDGMGLASLGIARRRVKSLCSK